MDSMDTDSEHVFSHKWNKSKLTNSLHGIDEHPKCKAEDLTSIEVSKMLEMNFKLGIKHFQTMLNQIFKPSYTCKCAPNVSVVYSGLDQLKDKTNRQSSNSQQRVKEVSLASQLLLP